MPSTLTPPFSTDPMMWHYDFIPPLIRALRPEVYVELGVREANLFNLVAPYAVRAIGVDIDPMSGECIESAANVEFRLCSTDEFLEEVKRTGLTIDVLFIDADHAQEAAYRDFNNYLPYVRPHGLILMHDGHPGDASLITPTQCGGVCRAVEELSADSTEYEMVTIPFSPGVTICRKRTKQLSWEEPDAGVGTARYHGADRPGAQAVTPEPAPAAAPIPGRPPLGDRVKAALRPVAAGVLGEDRLKRMLARMRGTATGS